MGKSWRNDAKNDRWRKQKQQKQNKGQKWQKSDNRGYEGNKNYSPFDDPPEYHQSFA